MKKTHHAQNNHSDVRKLGSLQIVYMHIKSSDNKTAHFYPKNLLFAELSEGDVKQKMHIFHWSGVQRLICVHESVLPGSCFEN